MVTDQLKGGIKMWIIISEEGCFPYLNLEMNEDGTVKAFETQAEAETWARENCAWKYKIIEWD
jgi:hypothetical protein